MFIDSKTVKFNIPESEYNSDAEKWEFYIAWQSVDSGVYNWLFTDFRAKLEVSGEVINSDNENITKKFKSTTNTFILIAENLTLNELETIQSILKAKVIRRYYKDNTYDNLAIVSKNNSYQHSDGRYDFKFEVQKVQNPLLK